jgi:glycosyltransferase involved in cell wall biosynthesis
VIHGHTGLVAGRRDAGELADLLIRVLTDPTEAELLGETARARCRELYGIERCGARYLDLYRSLGASGRAPLNERNQDTTLTGEPR